MKIHAYAALAPKQPLEPFVYEPAPLGPHEVLIKVSHSGLCHSDIHLIDDDWNRSIYPLVPGHEVVGTIVKKGEQVEEAKIGQRVGVSWIRSSCLCCPVCLQGDTNICPDKTTTCNGHYGGFGDHMVADSRFVFPIPEELSSAHAAPLLCAGATVYTPLRRMKIQGCHSVAVIGIGGLGHLALKFSAAFGCEVTAISHSSGKKREAISFGAHHFHSLEKLPAPMQFDLILSTVHTDLNWNQILTLLKPNGTLCFLGRPMSPAPIEISNILSLQRNITGSSTANRTLMNEMLAFAARSKIAPQIEQLPLSQVNQGIERVKSNKARYRIVLSIEKKI